MKDSLKWCARLKDGISITEQDETLAKSYLNEAKASLRRAEKNLADGDLLWATVVIYYAEYYALYSFLQRIGVKCENHFCSILAVERLAGMQRTNTIKQHKGKRLDAQYYMRIGKEEQVKLMLREAKIFIAEFDTFVSNLTNEEILEYGKRIKAMIK
ncbi:MAG: hypothetical protein ABIF85_01080 [Nanoarchaeota archaeon]